MDKIKRRPYIAPAIEVHDMVTSPIMLALSVENPGLIINGDTSINTRDEQLGRTKRGTWGNLWSDSGW